ncbi:hypothetical protein [Nocardia sp. NPDC004711]
MVFLGGLTAVNHATPADRRAEVLSSFYVIVFLATSIGLIAAVRHFAVVVAAL